MLCCAWLSTLRDLAERLGITERAVQSIVAQLVESGYLEKERVGRRNQYRLVEGMPMRHPVEAGRSVDDLIRLLRPSGQTPPGRAV